MPNQVHNLRSSTAGARPTGRSPGEFYVNFADEVIGYIDAAGLPVDLKTGGSVTIADAAPATPAAGDLWWDSLTGQLNIFYSDGTSDQWVAASNSGGGGGSAPLVEADPLSLHLTGGTLSGPLEGTAANFAVGVTSQAFETHATAAGGGLAIDGPAGLQTKGIFWRTGGVVRWGFALDSIAEGGGNSGSNLGLVGYDDAGLPLPSVFTVDRASGITTFQRAIIRNDSNTTERDFRGTTSGVVRWQMSLGNATPEDGITNIGSNYQLNSFADTGAYLGTPLQINRATAVATFQAPIVNGSDKRLKSNVALVDNALAIIEQLQGVFYNFKDTEKRQVGLIAQDVLGALPEVVFETPPVAGIAATKDEPMLGVAYGNIVAVLVNAVKELSARVVALEGGPAREVNALKGARR